MLTWDSHAGVRYPIRIGCWKARVKPCATSSSGASAMWSVPSCGATSRRRWSRRRGWLRADRAKASSRANAEPHRSATQRSLAAEDDSGAKACPESPITPPITSLSWARTLHRLHHNRPVQHSFQQMPLGGDGLSGCTQGRIAFGGDNYSFVPFCPDLITFNLNATDVGVVSGVQSIREAQDGGELDCCFLLVGKEIAQRFVPSGGQGSTMKASDDGGALQVFGLPA